MQTINVAVVIASLWLACSASTACADFPTDTQRDQAIDSLRRELVQQEQFVKVHAAEALLDLSYDQDVQTTFENELKKRGQEPRYRTGILRVLARAAQEPNEREKNVKQLRDIYLNTEHPDRVHALEALAKLRAQLSADDQKEFLHVLPANDADANVCLHWLFATSGNQSEIRILSDLLDSKLPRERRLAAYALRHLKDKLPRDVVKRLQERAEIEPEPEARVHVLSAAFVTSDNPQESQQRKKALLALAEAGSTGDKYEMLQALAVRGSADDTALALQLMSDSDADVRIGAAYALLRIDRRRPSSFATADWIVLFAYAAGMMAIGWYFSRRSSSSEDYILAGRSMKALPVGLSYFATLFSTITYLSAPGEVIRNGPMILGVVVLYPLVFLIVGYLLIPFIMRLHVATAYEILEKRFGTSVRMLGSGIFLSLRFAWMAMILFGMSGVVLVPLLGLDPSATPWVALIIAVLTVCYTAIGGLKAVIWSDVAQALILMLGILVSILVITWRLGGVSEWWPDTWAANWEQPRFWFNPSARITIASAALSQFTWYICTAGSDQMAVQRYLATKDIRSARRMFATSLCCDTFVAALLVTLGLALFSYYSHRPEALPDAETLVTGADRLFPEFIVSGLPVGISGLIIAGLASAAMSSLSSGVSSTSSVITLDFVNRFRRESLSDRGKLRVARAASWIVGAIIVALSLLAISIEGNLFEKTFRFINLFTAPLFVLFFMAMFVRRATTFSAWVACLSSWAVAAAIAYTDLTGLSVFWIMPAALVTGITVGSLVSLLPVGRPRPMIGMAEPNYLQAGT